MSREIPKVTGLDGRQHPARPLTESERQERTILIKSLREEGLSIRAIVAQTGYPVGTVHRALQAKKS